MSALSLEAVPALAAGVRLQKDTITGNRVLLFPEGVLELNETAGEIVQLCDGGRTVAEIFAALATEFEAERDELAADVEACIEELRVRRLLTT